MAMICDKLDVSSLITPSARPPAPIVHYFKQFSRTDPSRRVRKERKKKEGRRGKGEERERRERKGKEKEMKRKSPLYIKA